MPQGTSHTGGAYHARVSPWAHKPVGHPTGNISHSHTYRTGVVPPVPRPGSYHRMHTHQYSSKEEFFPPTRVTPLVTYPLRVGPVHIRPTTMLVVKVALLATTCTHNSLCLSIPVPEARLTGTITTIPHTLQPPALGKIGKEGIMQPSSQLKGRIVTALLPPPNPTELAYQRPKLGYFQRRRPWTNQPSLGRIISRLTVSSTTFCVQVTISGVSPAGAPSVEVPSSAIFACTR